ncbi:MAG: hypothetical protein B7Z37_25590, partial [Verrucomicrobia bacterium 12-59-8]
MSRNTLNPLSEIWQVVAGRLELQFTDKSTRQAVCPFCRKGLATFYPDPFTLGRRFITNCCNLAGDQFDLVAQMRRIERDQAILMLLNLSPELAELYRESASRRDRFNAEWNQLKAIWDRAVNIADAYSQVSFAQFV